jgi:hypothetical protein
MIGRLFTTAVLLTGPQREYDIEAKIQQVMSMGFDEVRITL